jgi:predicted MFS family arabinose efflux permease
MLQLCFLAGPMLSMIDSSVVNVAVPVIVRGLHTSLGSAAWAVSGYLLGLASGLAATPWLARRFGTLRAYGAALFAFTVASAGCALVPTVGLLIAARAVQGLVGAAMVPLAMSLILDPGRSRDRARGHAGQRRPRAVRRAGPRPRCRRAADQRLRLAQRVPGQRPGRGARPRGRPGGPAGPVRGRGTRPPGPRRPSRRPGLILLAAGLGLATYGASKGPELGWLSAGSAPAWASGLALMACYVLRERRAGRGHRAPPAVNLALLRPPVRALALALACVASVVLFAVLFLAPVFLQQIQHHDTTVTGLVLLPQGVVMGLAAWLGNVLVERGKTRPAVITASVSGGLALLAASTLGMLLLTASTPLWVTTTLLCGRGVALGLTVQPLVMALLDGLGSRLMADANTLFSMAERLSGSFGIALLATLYASRAAATGSPVTALHDCVLVLAVAAAVGAVAAACQHGRVRH